MQTITIYLLDEISLRKITNTHCKKILSHKCRWLTFEHGADLPDSQAAQTGELAKGQLQEEEGDAAEHQHDEVR